MSEKRKKYMMEYLYNMEKYIWIEENSTGRIDYELLHK